MAEESTHGTAKLETRTRFDIRPQVFGPAVVIILLFVTLGAAFPDRLADVFSAVQGWISQHLGWFYLTAVTVFLIFAVWLALSRFGSKRLGPDDATPDHSTFSWLAMLFSAGMGIGLMFYSVAEPISHYGIEVPPSADADAETAAAAQEAMTTTFFHWGLHAWAVYVVVALALCYFAYRRGLPLTMRSAFHPLLGDRIYHWPGDVIDVLAIVGTLFGVATSLGIGATQIGAGLGFLDVAESDLPLQLGLVAAITLVATGSVVLGLTRGIRRLSLFNVGVGGALLLFVLIAGPTVFILNGLTESTGAYLQRLPSLSLGTDLLGGGTWTSDWTLFYWGWWVSWSPFVGMFIARISRGRTVREFISGVLIVPTLVTFVVLAVFGEAAFHSELEGPGGILAAAQENLDIALFSLLEQLPLATITSLVAIVVIASFFITSSDSGSLVDDIHASGGSLDPHPATRVFWALAEGAVAAVLLSAGGQTGLEALQQASIATGIPLALLLLGACLALYRAFRDERPEDVIAGTGAARDAEESPPERPRAESGR